MRREGRGTVQGPVKKQQPDGMSHRGGHGHVRSWDMPRVCVSFWTDLMGASDRMHMLPFMRDRGPKQHTARSNEACQLSNTPRPIPCPLAAQFLIHRYRAVCPCLRPCPHPCPRTRLGGSTQEQSPCGSHSTPAAGSPLVCGAVSHRNVHVHGAPLHEADLAGERRGAAPLPALSFVGTPLDSE